jgi:NAD-dependent deacetylase
MTDLARLILQAAALLREAQAAVAFTGAGISTPSGIPDFRSAGSGLWQNTDPMEVASLTSFRYHPEKFYAWVRPLASIIQQAQSNAAHRALADLESAHRLKLVMTQNIDDLHTRAGSEQVLELHGNLRQATCGHCHQVWPGGPMLAKFIEDGALPRCPDCGGVLKPNVILMGEQLPETAFRQARRAARQCDVMLVAGSSLEVMPSAALPLEAVTHGAQLIIINLEPTYLDERADVLIHADVADVLPQIAAAAGCGTTGYG